MEVILRQDVDKVGLRGEVVNVARGYARNFLFPRGLADEATPARVAELRKVEERRASHEAKTFEDAQSVAERLGAGRAALRRQGRPDRLAVRLGHADGHRGPALGEAQGPRRPAQDRHATRSSASAATRCRSSCSRTSPSRCARSSCPRAASCRPRRSSRRWRQPSRPRRPRGRGSRRRTSSTSTRSTRRLPRRTAAQLAADELQPSAADVAGELQDDEFDRAVDAGRPEEQR